MTPLMIQMLLACDVSGDPIHMMGVNIWESASGIESRNWLLREGLVEENCRTTERGRALVEMLCATPLPVQKTIWVKGDA